MKGSVLLILLCFNIYLSDEDGSFTIKNPIQFPYGPIQAPFMGVFVAISLPLDLPEYNIFFSYNFEANYELPQNETEFSYPPLVSKRSWDRKFFYDVLEYKMKSHGFPGRHCLLRTICEATLHSSQHTGILGDILHILLTPSTSVNKDIPNDYEMAEQYGAKFKHCKKYNKKCSISLLDLISQIGHFL